MAEGLMIAQVMADLQTLQNADPTASRSLLSASALPPPTTRPSLSTLSPQTTRSKTSTSIPRVTDSSSQYPLSPTSPAPSQKPRRPVIPRSASNTATPPPLTRSTSSFGRLNGNTGNGGYGGRGSISASLSASRSGSGVGTPVEGTQDQNQNQNPDLARAKTLLELFEMRGKFKQMGDTGLTRAKQRVDNVVEKYARMELAEREKAARDRHLS